MKSLKSRVLVISMMLIMTCLVQAQGGVQLYGVDRDEGDSSINGGLYTIDQQTGEYFNVVSTTEGGDFKHVIAMALDTSDSETVYVVYEADGSDRATRSLGTINLNTGVITSIAALDDAVADIAFDDMGQMYGIVGDGGTDSSTLFSIDKSTAVMTLMVAMDSNLGDGEALGYNFDDGLLYRRSGNGSDENELTSIDPSNPVPSSTLVIGADSSAEGLALLYDIDTGLFLELDRDERLVTIDPVTAELSVIGTDPGTNYLRGLMYFPSKQDLIFYDGFETVPPPPVR
ncbi:MAG: hypothetical protein ACSHWU_03650 [Marinicella sp.]